jgi:hypothetical protein
VRRAAIGSGIAALTLAACGGGANEDEQHVKDATLRFVNSSVHLNASGMCDSVTPGTRSLLMEIARLRLSVRRGSCAPLLRDAGMVGQVSLPAAGAMAQLRRRIRVKVEGDRAGVVAPASLRAVRLRRVGPQWALELRDMRDMEGRMRFAQICAASLDRGFRSPLPRPTAGSIASYWGRAAAIDAELARRLAALYGPTDLTHQGYVVGALRADAAAYRIAARRLHQPGRPAQIVRTAHNGLRRAMRRAFGAVEGTDIPCIGGPASTTVGQALRAKAGRVCRAASRKVAALPRPSATSVSEAADAIDRLVATERPGLKRLEHAIRDGPVQMRRPLEAGIQAQRAALRWLAREGAAIRRLDLAGVDDAFDHLVLHRERALLAFSKLELRHCQEV